MIIRQVCARNGSSIISNAKSLIASTPNIQRNYASNPSITNSSPKRSTQSSNPERVQAPQPRSIPGHPDQPSSILDTSPHASTGRTRTLEHRIEDLEKETQSLSAEVGSHASTKQLSLNDLKESTSTTLPTKFRPPQSTKARFPYQTLQDYNAYRRHVQLQSRKGTHLSQTYNPDTIIHEPPHPSQLTLPLLLANQTHLGHATALWNPSNSQYIFGIRDGIHIISLDTTFAYLQRASKVIESVAQNGGIILFVGTRRNQEEIVIGAAKRAGGYHIYDRWTPGTLTNGQQILGECALKVVDVQDQEMPEYQAALNGNAVLRPDLVVVLNPIENQVCLHECGIYNVPTMGIIDTDADPSWVTYPIPANDDSRRSVALIAGVLSKAAQNGQQHRLELAKRGKATYETDSVKKQMFAWKREVESSEDDKSTNLSAVAAATAATAAMGGGASGTQRVVAAMT